MKISFFVVLQVVFTSISYSQVNSVKELKGRVTSAQEDIVGIAIQNKTRNSGTITDQDGKFTITVHLGDTLVFSAIQYKRKILTVDDSIFRASSITVVMEEFVNQLSEVVLNPYSLSGNIGLDLSNLKLEAEVNAITLGLPNGTVEVISPNERKLYEADHGKFVYYYGLGASINLNKVLNRLNGRTKKLKNTLDLESEDMAMNAVREVLEDSLFINELRIPSGKQEEFLLYCQSDDKFLEVLKEEDNLKIWALIKEKSELYRESNNLD